MQASKSRAASRRSLIMAGLTLLVAAFCGCTKSKGPATLEVTGIVTLNGTAVEGANVFFSPAGNSEASRLSSQATTDNNGKYQLRTHIGAGQFKPGIVPGKYEVTVSKLDTASIKNTMSPPKNLLPAKYADAKTSPFKADVVAGQANDFPLDLKAE